MRRRLIYALFLLIFVPMGTEGAYRLLLRVRGGIYDSQRARERVLEIASSVSAEAPRPGDAEPLEEIEDGVILSPYTAFDLDWSVGLMADDLKAQASTPEGQALILVTGGSVAHHLVQIAGERIVQRLARDPLFGREPRLLNYARSSFKQPQQLAMVGWLLSSGLEPDVVVNLDGFNEVAIGRSNAHAGTHPLFPFEGRWGRLVDAEAIDPRALELLAELLRRREDLQDAAQRTLSSGRLRSAILGRVSLSRLTRLRRLTAEADEALAAHFAEGEAPPWRRGPSFVREETAVAEMCVRAWREGSLSLAGMCEKRGIVYLHVLQPNMHDEGSKPLTDEERSSDLMGPIWGEGARGGYPLMRVAGAELDAAGVHFVDASGIYGDVEETIYFDGCHMLERGNFMLADTLAEALLKAMR